MSNSDLEKYHTVEEQKKAAAIRAVDFIESGMVVGLGTGSTVKFALEEIARRLRDRELKEIVGICSSNRTEEISKNLKIPLVKLEERTKIDVTIDGADEADPKLNLIKGGGGALLKEKILAQSSQKNIIMVDKGKLSQKIGEKWELPVEIVPYAVSVISKKMREKNLEPTLRKNSHGSVFETDLHNFILDVKFSITRDEKEIARELKEIAGVIEHGFFLDICDTLCVADEREVHIVEKGNEKLFNKILRGE